MIYSLIILGAGAAGLYAGASLPSSKDVLILEKGSRAGRKLLLTGNGQCNLTHSGNIKEFIAHYGQNGGRIRTALYHHSNRSVIDYFESIGIKTLEREDGKVFPASLDSREVVDALVKKCSQNGVTIHYSSPVVALEKSGDYFTVVCPDRRYQCRKVLVATGGCSYPSTGSDGGVFPLLENLGVALIERRPALVPVFVNEYPYASCAGISFRTAKLSILKKAAFLDTKAKIYETRGSLLLTHHGFSGPLLLDNSRYLSAGDRIRINYFPEMAEDHLADEFKKAAAKSKKQLITLLADFFRESGSGSAAELPRRFLETICFCCRVDPAMKAAQTKRHDLENLVKSILRDEFTVERLGPMKTAMVTAGGVDLDGVDLKTMESKRVPGLYFAGEVLDVDGDTGGYNLQFAFSSAYIAVNG